jgi:hypothetical protein
LTGAISSFHPGKGPGERADNMEKQAVSEETRRRSCSGGVDRLASQVRAVLAGGLYDDCGMDLNTILAGLKIKRAQIDHAIVALTPLTPRRTRRGRPPLWLSQANSTDLQKSRERPQGPKNVAG